MTELARAEVLDYLRALGERDFINLLYESFVTRNDDGQVEARKQYLNRWCLATSTFSMKDGVADDAPLIELIGLASPPHTPYSSEEYLCQDGKCIRCGALVVSVSKMAVCPVCSNEVRCT